MKIIISPAKKMNQETDLAAPKALPCFLSDTKKIYETLSRMSPAELQKLWKCNDQLAALNIDRLQHMKLEGNLTPAVLSYEGLQYQHLRASVFTEQQVAYVEEHLRILSGFYGVLRPYDGVTPYRLEMQAKLSVEGAKDLYAFWGERLYKALAAEEGVARGVGSGEGVAGDAAGDLSDTKSEAEGTLILNLASKEYSKAVEPYLKPADRMITVVFGELKDGKVIEKGTFAKMSRGEMVSYLSEENITDPEAMKQFSWMGLEFDPTRSDESRFVFLH